NPLYPVFRGRDGSPSRPSEVAARPAVAPYQFVDFDEATVEIGHGGDDFAYDNEGPQHRALVPAFSLAGRLATHGEFVDFIEAGGYKRPEFWLSLGWMTVNEQRWQAPLYWTKRDDKWWHFTLSGFRPVDENEPVTHVSYFEADAFANWSGARLPTEFEWECVAQREMVEGNFVESERFHTAPTKAAGLSQLFGDVWEWKSSSYSLIHGISVAPGSLGVFNGKFMCN